jgi:hypothetical protein
MTDAGFKTGALILGLSVLFGSAILAVPLMIVASLLDRLLRELRNDPNN